MQPRRELTLADTYRRMTMHYRAVVLFAMQSHSSDGSLAAPDASLFPLVGGTNFFCCTRM